MEAKTETNLQGKKTPKTRNSIKGLEAEDLREMKAKSRMHFPVRDNSGWHDHKGLS